MGQIGNLLEIRLFMCEKDGICRYFTLKWMAGNQRDILYYLHSGFFKRIQYSSINFDIIDRPFTSCTVTVSDKETKVTKSDLLIMCHCNPGPLFEEEKNASKS